MIGATVRVEYMSHTVGDIRTINLPSLQGLSACIPSLLLMAVHNTEADRMHKKWDESATTPTLSHVLTMG